MRTPTFVPCLLPNALDFGAVQPGDTVGKMAGICNWPAAAQVTAALTNDNSGGLFTTFSLTIYSVEPGGQGNGGPKPSIPRPVWELVATATGDGSNPLPVAPGQTVGVGLFFNAPPQPSHKQFSATIQIRTGAAISAVIPVTAVVEAPAVSVNWTLANPFGIEWKSLSTTDPLVGVFHAGHVNDVLVLANGALLVGTDAAGVWIVQQPGSSVSPAAASLTDNWDVNTVSCLCQGPHGSDHVYVGAGHPWPPSSPGVVYETEDLFATWRDISPPGVGNVYKILVTNFGTPRRVVVASDGGVFWSNIPQPNGAYQWNQVSKLTNGQPFPSGAYSGLALGPNDRIVVAAWGANISSGHYGIFYGDWFSLVPGHYSLAMTASQIPPGVFVPFGWGMGRTSLASSPQNPLVMYAVSAQTSGDITIYAVLASTPDGTTWTGGEIWTQVSTPAFPVPFHQGWYNNCLAASPSDPKVVALGWQKHFVSRDSGRNWQLFDEHAGLPALHDDIHGVYFDPSNPPNERLYICSDGGVALTIDGGQTFDSSFNRFLANLECYGSNPVLSVRDNFLASGTQDNGDVYCVLRPGSNPDVSPWVQVADGLGDGGYVAFIATGQLIANVGSNVFRPRTSIPFDVDGDTPFESDKPVQIPVPGNGIVAIDAVATPNYPSIGQKMYAVGGQSSTQNVYGLFADLDGGNLNWKLVGNVSSALPGDSISALAPLNDGTVLVGTGAGEFFLLRLSPSGLVTGQPLPVALPPGISTGQVNRIVWSGTLAFATFNTSGGGTILRFDGTSLSPADSGLPGGPYTGLATDGFGRVWTCTDDRVFVSRDGGLTWQDASAGLPRRTHCQELRYNFVQQNPPLLYLSTYGHSVWVTDVLD